MTKFDTLATLQNIHKECGQLIKMAEEFARSADPKLRTYGYEMLTNVAKITAKAKQITEEMVGPEDLCPANGYGGLVD